MANIFLHSTIRFNFVGADIRGTRLERDCPALPDCPVDDKYRTFDGSCNNLHKPEWGKANTDVQRFVLIHFEFQRMIILKKSVLSMRYQKY